MKAKQIETYLNARLVGNPEKEIEKVAHIDLAKPNELTYCSLDSLKQTIQKLNTTNAGTIITYPWPPESIPDYLKSRITFLMTENPPRYAFGKTVEKFFMWQTHQKPQIGENVKIHPTAAVGVEGMNYERGVHGDLQKVPHTGNLIISDNVTVEALTVIQKGVLKDTVIGEGTKIGPNCNIGHGAHIGEDCLITGMNFVGGSVVLGNRVYIAPHCTIKNGVKVGDDAFIGIGSLVLHDVPNGATVVGRPAVPLEQFKAERERLKWLLQKPKV